MSDAKRQPSSLAKESATEARRLPPQELLERLPANVRESIVEAWAFSGPLPPPSMYKGYESVHKGSAERILSMAEGEQAHRFDWERRELGFEVRNALLGKWLAFGISIVCIGNDVYLAIHGQPWVAGILAETSMVALAGRFIEGRQRNR